MKNTLSLIAIVTATWLIVNSYVRPVHGQTTFSYGKCSHTYDSSTDTSGCTYHYSGPGQLGNCTGNCSSVSAQSGHCGGINFLSWCNLYRSNGLVDVRYGACGVGGYTAVCSCNVDPNSPIVKVPGNYSECWDN